MMIRLVATINDPEESKTVLNFRCEVKRSLLQQNLTKTEEVCYALF